MLTPLNQAETEQFTKHLITDFPRQLLYLIGSADGQRERQLCHWMQTWLPNTIPRDLIQEWVSRSLEWFINDGHIQRQSGGGYSCLPPYLVGGSEQLAGKAYLYGHPYGSSILLQQQCKPIAQPVYDASFQMGPLGYERICHITPQQKRAARIKCIEADQLADALPAIADLRVPDVALTEVLPAGMCQCYAPRFAGQAFEKRWISFTESDAHKHRLIRWLPSKEPNDRYAARYFYWIHTQYAVALHYEDAVLWRMSIDAETYPQSVWWHAQSEELFLPLGLPASYWQWIYLATLQRPVRDAQHHRLNISADVLPTIKNVLVRNLKLVWTQGRPT